MQVSPALARNLERIGLEFLASFFQAEIGRYPDNVDALAELGHVYTRLERHGDGLDVDARLARLLPDNPTVQYNLACSLALVGRAAESVDALERAVELGYDDLEFLLADDDLASLADDSRFQDLVSRMELRERSSS